MISFWSITAKRLWKDRESFLNSSRLHYVTRSQTRTLVMHGKEEPRVPPSQSLNFSDISKDWARRQRVCFLSKMKLYTETAKESGGPLAHNLRRFRWMQPCLQCEGGNLPNRLLDDHEALEIAHLEAMQSGRAKVLAGMVEQKIARQTEACGRLQILNGLL